MPSPPRLLAGAARVVAELVALDAHRVLQLKASMGVLRVLLMPTWTPEGPGPLGAGALAAADGLVVGPAAAAADDRVVHRPLALRRNPLRREAGERREHGVGDPVARLDVSGHDRRRVRGVDQAALRGLYLQRGVGAGVGGDVLGQQDAQGEVAGRAGDRQGAVDVAGHGVRGAA